MQTQPPDSPESNARDHAALALAVSHSPVIFYLAALESEQPLSFISANVETITGHSQGDFLSRSGVLEDLIHPGDRLRQDWNVAALQTDNKVADTCRLRTKGGDFRLFRHERRLTERPDGTFEIAGCLVDMGEALDAQDTEDSLDNRIEALIRPVVEACPVPIAMTRAADGAVIYESPATRTLLGERPNDTPKTWAALCYAGPEDADELMARLRRDRRLDGFEMTFHRANGTTFPGAIAARVIEHLGEDVVVSVIHDLSDQVLRREELRQARETLEDAIESLSEGLVLYDANNRLVLCNTQYKEFNGDCADLLIPGAFWPDVTRRRAERGFFTAAATGIEDWLAGQMAQRGIARREEFNASDGRWFEYSHRTTRQGGFVSTWSDITERKTMEQALRGSEELVRRILEASPLPVRMWDPESGQVIYESPACREMLGRDATKLNSEERLSVYVDLEDRERYLARLRASGAVDNVEMELRRADGSTFWAAVSARVADYQERQVVVSSIVDLSERREIELALRERQQLVRQVLSACPVPITMNRVDDGVIIYESPAAGALLGYDTPREGTSVIDRWADPADRAAYLKLLKASGGAVDGLEIRYLKANGQEFPCAISSRLIEYRGEPVIVSNLVDLTERNAAEAKLAQQRELLYQSEKLSALGELLAGVSHELNNPLSVLVGQAVLLKETSADAQLVERAARIGEAANRCARIVKSFLAMARQEPLESKSVDMAEVIEEALDVTAYFLRSSDIDTSLRLAQDLPTVTADPGQLRQVLTNLIVNAQHALQDKDGERKLRVTAAYDRANDRIVVKIKDNGPGVPEDLRGRIFDPLFTTKEVGTGTGMGLAICHRVVESHGGTLTLENEPGVGAVFALRLPVTGPAAPSREVESAAAIAPGCLRVLVVDDDQFVGEIIGEILEYEGHVTEVAHSGKQALAMLAKNRFDVILSDYRMPEMDGPSFYRALGRQNPDHIDRLAFITGDTLGPGVKAFLESTERPFLEKPITPEDVVELIDLLVRRHQA